MKANRILLLTLALASATAFAAERNLSLLPAASGDQVPGVLVTAVSTKAGAGLDRAPARFSWAIPSDEKLVAQQPQVRESREYWTRASAAQLEQGFALHTTAPGALVRLSPVDGTIKTALNLDQVEIRKGGAAYGKRTAMTQAADTAQLEAAGASFPEGTIAFKLREEIGSGELRIAVAKATGSYLVHVFEPQSDRVLMLGADRDTALAQGELAIKAQYQGAASVDAIGGVLTSPSGRNIDLEFVREADGSYVAKVSPPLEVSTSGPALWEVHTFASAEGGAVQRDAKTVVAVAVPSARLDGSAGVAKAAVAERAFSFGVEVASASRYELRGVLYATSEAGVLVPAAVAHAAAWLEPGQRRMELRYDAAALADGPWRAPFEVRDLVLANQADMAPIERRGRALRTEAR